MTKKHWLLIAAAFTLGLIVPGTARAQTDCGLLKEIPPHTCGSGCSYPTTYACIEGHQPCYNLAKIVWCPCDINQSTSTSDSSGTCDEAVQTTEKVPFVKTVQGGTRAFRMYFPNCKGGYSVKEMIT